MLGPESMGQNLYRPSIEVVYQAEPKLGSGTTKLVYELEPKIDLKPPFLWVETSR